MSIIVLIPAILAIVALVRGSVRLAFFDVYLPVLMLFPTFYFWKVAALPPIDVTEAALIPIGLALVLTQMSRWRPSLTDAALIVFIYTTWYADSLAGLSTASTFELFSNIVTAAFPYMIGKLLIEQPGARIPTVKRFVLLLFAASIIGAYEYRMGMNPFSLLWARFFPGESFAWKTQIRWGFGRVSGPYGQSELAGIIFFTGIVLALYLAFYQHWEPKFKRLRFLPVSKATLITAVLVFTLLMTQARGPWLGCLVAVPIALIGRSRHILRTALIVIALLGLIGPVAYLGIKRYTSPTASGPQVSAEQQTAQYRQQMLDGYIPIAQKGGDWGWGKNFPRVPGFDSIDNEYLLVFLTQGTVGLASFCLICLFTLINFAEVALFGRDRPDKYFGWSMLGIYIGMLLTIFTVFLGLQTFQIFFLLAGWSQALKYRGLNFSLEEKPEFAFEHIYT